jgi:hypothetical protein
MNLESSQGYAGAELREQLARIGSLGPGLLHRWRRPVSQPCGISRPSSSPLTKSSVVGGRSLRASLHQSGDPRSRPARPKAPKSRPPRLRRSSRGAWLSCPAGQAKTAVIPHPRTADRHADNPASPDWGMGSAHLLETRDTGSQQMPTRRADSTDAKRRAFRSMAKLAENGCTTSPHQDNRVLASARVACWRSWSSIALEQRNSLFAGDVFVIPPRWLAQDRRLRIPYTPCTGRRTWGR